MATGTFAAATAGLFTGTAPHQGYCRAYNKDQGKELLPFHAANITAKAIPATGIFILANRLSFAIASAKSVCAIKMLVLSARVNLVREWRR